MVRPRKGQDGQSTDDLIRAVLRKTAHVHYSKQGAQRREEVRKSFYALDTSGDGRISLEEFLQSAEKVVSGGSSRVIAKIFSYMDEDKSGFLEFDEFIVVTFIMEAGFQICDHCLAPVVIGGYTCKTCWSQRGHENHDTFDLCSSCFISDSEGINHPSSHELVDTCHMYHYLLTTTSPPGGQVLEENKLSNNGLAYAGNQESTSSKTTSTPENSSDPTFADLITAQMESNLILQQSYFHAARMHNYGVGMFYLAPG